MIKNLKQLPVPYRDLIIAEQQRRLKSMSKAGFSPEKILIYNLEFNSGVLFMYNLILTEREKFN